MPCKLFAVPKIGSSAAAQPFLGADKAEWHAAASLIAGPAGAALGRRGAADGRQRRDGLMVGPWRHPPGTLRALWTILGHDYVLCRRCRRFAAITIPRGMEDRPYDPCPSVCWLVASAVNLATRRARLLPGL